MGVPPTVRVSVGIYNTTPEVDVLAGCLAETQKVFRS